MLQECSRLERGRCDPVAPQYARCDAAVSSDGFPGTASKNVRAHSCAGRVALKVSLNCQLQSGSAAMSGCWRRDVVLNSVSRRCPVPPATAAAAGWGTARAGPDRDPSHSLTFSPASTAFCWRRGGGAIAGAVVVVDVADGTQSFPARRHSACPYHPPTENGPRSCEARGGSRVPQRSSAAPGCTRMPIRWCHQMEYNYCRRRSCESRRQVAGSGRWCGSPSSNSPIG